MRTSHIARALAAVCLAGSGVVGLASAPAYAATPCRVINFDRYECHNTYNAPIYQLSWVNGDYQVIRVNARMLTTTSWFSCRIDDGPYVGGPHPNRWLWTQGDVREPGSTTSYGYMKDTSISSETNSVRTC
ncbi:hypothetical protein E1293_29120 [Actinomadura darangshiensis]|uniref:Ig-like domain-containing protein n=1 Tax=Actinomadura darangshiensis TaxID=705336 RepID=A0A4R5AVZ2_9ACTN|nr:hypothetical protein [Actinomadura darangshiensis]TDD74792.1 hypothetical protein E1293_29120 [Actinomadura darangshiensis]